MTTPSTGRFRYVNEAVGLLFLVSLALFFAAVLGSGKVREWIDPGERLRVILPEGGLFGLSEGADVETLGTKVGKVSRIVIDPDQRMFAEVLLREEMTPFIRRDSRVTIRKRFGVAGAAYLEISRGTGEPMDWDYAVLEAQADRPPTDALPALVEELEKRIIPVIDDTHQAIRTFASVASDLQDPEGDLQRMLGHLSSITGSISRGEGAVGRLMVDRQVADDLQAMLADVNRLVRQLAPLLESLGATAENVSALSGTFRDQADSIPELSESVQRLLASLNTVLSDLSRTTPELPRIARSVGDAASGVPVLTLQVQQVMLELERLLQQLQSHWLIGGGKAGAAPAASGRISPLEVRP